MTSKVGEILFLGLLLFLLGLLALELHLGALWLGLRLLAWAGALPLE